MHANSLPFFRFRFKSRTFGAQQHRSWPEAIPSNNKRVSSIKRDQLDVTWFLISLFNAQHVSDINTSLLRAFDLFVELFHGLYFSVRIEFFALAYLFSGECLVVSCVVVLESVFLQILAAAVSYGY